MPTALLLLLPRVLNRSQKLDASQQLALRIAELQRLHVAVQDWIRFPPEAGLPQSLGSLQSSVTPDRWLSRSCPPAELTAAADWIQLSASIGFLVIGLRLLWPKLNTESGVLREQD